MLVAFTVVRVCGVVEEVRQVRAAEPLPVRRSSGDDAGPSNALTRGGFRGGRCDLRGGGCDLAQHEMHRRGEAADARSGPRLGTRCSLGRSLGSRSGRALHTLSVSSL